MSAATRDARFGAVDGAVLVVATVVGAGIFTVPGYVASLAGTRWLALALWVAGGALALCGALCYAELAARCPRGGGEYAYLREAFGDTVGFLSGWTSLVAGFSGAIAASAMGFAAHLPGTLPPVPLALALIGVSTAVGVAGVTMSRVVTGALALLIVAGIAAMTLAGVLRPVVATTPAAAPTFAAVAALVPIFFTYSGWNAAAYVTPEFRDPRRDVPRALIGGTVAVTLLYVGVNLAVLRALPLPALAADGRPVATAAHALLGRVGGALTSGLALAALASSVCAMVITGPRIYEEMARDGALPAVFARRRRGVPWFAVVAQSLWSGVLVASGSFEQIVSYTGFAIVVFSGAAVAALVVLRRRAGAPAGFRVPGFPYLPVAFVACTAVIAVASLLHAPGPSAAGVVLILSGLAFRRFGARRTRGPGRVSRPDPLLHPGRTP